MEVAEIFTPGCPKCENPLLGKKATHLPDCPRRKPGRPKNLVPSDDLTPALELENASIREVVCEAFNRLGGLNGLVKWGRRNPLQFYRLWGSLGPRFSPGRTAKEGPKGVRVNIAGLNGEGD